jgi:hypothetical protein
MATWKKVVISGSDISQLNNDSQYLVSGDSGIELSGSFSGSFEGEFSGVLADGTTATTQTIGDNSTKVATTAYVDAVATAADLDLVGDGSTTTSVDLDSQTLTFTGNDGLQLSASAQTITATIADGGIANAKLANSTISGKALGTNLDNLTDGNGIADFTYNGSTAASIAVQADSTTGGNTVPVSVSANGVGLDVDSIDGTGLTANAGVLDVDYGATAGTAVEGDTTITVNGTTNAIDITGTAAQALGGAPVYTVDLSDTIDGDRTFTNDVIIGGDLTVQGTASFQNTENLLVSDRFVLFASGSTTTGDGGIVVQQATQDVGELFGYDSGTTRWAVDSAFDASTSAFTPEAFMAAVVEGADTNPDNAPARYDKKGNIFVGTDEGIWIYS